MRVLRVLRTWLIMGRRLIEVVGMVVVVISSVGEGVEEGRGGCLLLLPECWLRQLEGGVGPRGGRVQGYTLL